MVEKAGTRPIGGMFILWIIAAGFCVITPFAAYAVLKPVGLAIAAQNWEARPAIILSSHVQSRNRQYRLRTEYSYAWKNETHVSRRTFFDETVGVRKSYYHQLNRQLSRHKSRNAPLSVWINPKNPSKAVIYRHIRWDKLGAGILFLGLLTVITFVLVRSAQAELKHKPAHDN
jgi:Protein of unknown function (DUF3592)